jgi:hypothetical protein
MVRQARQLRAVQAVTMGSAGLRAPNPAAPVTKRPQSWRYQNTIIIDVSTL